MPSSVAIWSLAPSPAHTRLATGCDHGAIADNQLELVCKLDPCKTRPQQIAVFLVAGGAEPSLRKWAAGSGRCLNRMTVEKLQGEHTLVWTVAVLNGTIILGNSLGNVHFWDAKSCVRRQTIRAHRADILGISANGCSVFTFGVDQKTCQLTLHIQSLAGNNSETTAAQSRWLLAASRRLHSHNKGKLGPCYRSFH
ncbi:hypothetical protein PtB15_17B301 [Puccinia triticina]|nr:hypothetical protein PtB15_17B301 [Puccinia triticina]